MANNAFDNGLDGWKINAPAEVRIEPTNVNGRNGLKIVVPANGPVGYPAIFQEIDVTPGTLIEARVDAMPEGVSGGFGVYAAVEFHDAAGKRISFGQSDPASREHTWMPLAVHSVTPPGAAKARLCLLLNGKGTGYFAGASLINGGDYSMPPLTGPVTLTVTDHVVCDSLKGFGAEDDGWFYDPENAAKGVDDEAIAIREGRVRWMKPSWVRMFCWYKDWAPHSGEPSGDWQTFTFDSPNMESHYRTLDLYQQLGTCVNIVGVEWGVDQPYKDLAKAAHAIGALFEHLIKDKGYSCVQEWTLTNEPNGYWLRTGNSFEDYARLHALVKEEFARRGLKVRVVGSDDTNGGFPWFTNCVQDKTYFETADLFASHHYFPFADRDMAGFFFGDRLDLLARQTPRKQLIVAEFGFQDARSGAIVNPIMEEYPYAVWTSAFVIEGLNRGVAGFCIWCLHEMYYPGNGFMNYGLWDFKNRNWQVRPVYHAWANFTRLTRAGDKVFKCDSTAPRHVLAAKVGKTVFWANRGDEKAEVRFEKFQPKQIHIMTQATLLGDRECGETIEPADNKFEAPPQSFGYAQ